MRVRDHVALSTATAALLAPWVGSDAVGLWAGSVLIDADHYAWFCLRQRRLDPRAALRVFNEARAPHHRATRMLHQPAAVLAALALGARRPRLLPVAVGVALHVAMDRHHETRMTSARGAALERDGHSCRSCGVSGEPIETHVYRQPAFLPSYSSSNVVSLCRRCHEAAHADRPGRVEARLT
jgi:hypothetical protein